MILGFMDPSLLSCPPNLYEEHVLLDYVQKLIEWRDLREQGWMQLVLPRTTADLLGSTNGFPPWEAVADVLSRNDYGIQPSDVFAVMDGFLTKTQTLEDLTGINEIILDGVTCDPDYFMSRGKPQADELSRLLGIISLYQTLNDLPLGMRQLLTTNAPCPHELQFRGVLQIVDFENELRDSPQTPCTLADRLIGTCCATSTLKHADALALWSSAENNVDIQTAIALSVFQRAQSEGVAVRPWVLGKSFYDSIRRLHLSNRAGGAKILRACCETILDASLDKIHALRTGQSGANPQVKRGVDLAFRRDVDYEFHLHYWSTSRGPELASIVVHNDFEIPA